MNMQIVPDTTIIFEDTGAWGYTPRQQRTGIILNSEPSKYHGRYFWVKAEGINLPKRIREDQVVAFVHPSVTNEKAEIPAEVVIPA